MTAAPGLSNASRRRGAGRSGTLSTRPLLCHRPLSDRQWLRCGGPAPGGAYSAPASWHGDPRLGGKQEGDPCNVSVERHASHPHSCSWPSSSEGLPRCPAAAHAPPEISHFMRAPTSPDRFPDGQTVMTDLQRTSGSCPSRGDGREKLTDDFLEPARPHWSPTGELVAFQSYTTGTFHIWVHEAGRHPGCTSSPTDTATPRAPVLARRQADRLLLGPRLHRHLRHLGGGRRHGALTQWTSGTTDEFEPSWTPDGKEIVFVSGTGAVGTTIQAMDGSGNARTLVTAPTGFRLNSPVMAPDGTRVAYEQFAANKSTLMVSGQQVGTSTDVFPFHVTWLPANRLLYTADGKVQAVSDVSGGTRRRDCVHGPLPVAARALQPGRSSTSTPGTRVRRRASSARAVSPDGTRVVFQALNQLWVMRIWRTAPAAHRRLGYYKCDPSWSPDGKRIAYSSDKAGTEDLYVLDLETGDRATGDLDRRRGGLLGLVAGRIAARLPGPDRRDLHGGHRHRRRPPGDRPSVRALEAQLVQGRQDPRGRRAEALHPPVPRGDEPDLHRRPSLGRADLHRARPVQVDQHAGRGRHRSTPPTARRWRSSWRAPCGSGPWTSTASRPARRGRSNFEVTDAPTWSGDSKTLLYLSNGELRDRSRARAARPPASRSTCPGGRRCPPAG